MNLDILKNIEYQRAGSRWFLDEALTLIRHFQPLFEVKGWHLGLTGSVLYRFESHKDLDLIVYPHKRTEQTKPDDALEVIKSLGFTLVEHRDHRHYNDSKTVYQFTYNNKRIDMFILL